MVAVCDPKYDISGYFSRPRARKRYRGDTRIRVQAPGASCVAPECRQPGAGISTVDWKCEAFELLECATSLASLDWRELYTAMLRAFPNPSVTKETTEEERRFAELAELWRDETAMLSSSSMIAMHPVYQRIIGMGPSAVPLILRQLEKEPDHWFWALTAITGESPEKPEDAGNVEKLAEAWKRLGRERGWI